MVCVVEAAKKLRKVQNAENLRGDQAWRSSEELLIKFGSILKFYCQEGSEDVGKVGAQLYLCLAMPLF